MSRPRADADISTLTVLRAVHTLRDGGRPPQTAAEIADYLVADTAVVQALLVELKSKRILRDRIRGSGATRRREWRRWDDR